MMSYCFIIVSTFFDVFITQAEKVFPLMISECRSLQNVSLAYRKNPSPVWKVLEHCRFLYIFPVRQLSNLFIFKLLFSSVCILVFSSTFYTVFIGQKVHFLLQTNE